MDLKVRGYLERAENELILAKANFELSTKEEIKQLLRISSGKTFFNDVISEAYYSIFYTAKAYLLNKGINTRAPEEHKKTYEEFKKLVENNELSNELLKIYEDALDKADSLLKIFFDEKRNRGRFTYNINANANLPFAEQSIKNARIFVSTIKSILDL